MFASWDMPSGMKYGQLSVLSVRNIRVVVLVCRNLGKEAARNPNCLQGKGCSETVRRQ